MRKEANFNNSIAEILRKSRIEEREMMPWKGKREKVISVLVLSKCQQQKKKTNKCFGNCIMEILSPWPYLPVSFIF